jgi:glutamyl-Q tRNA(Asp) synthetase
MSDSQPVFRFAPSPNGELHIGHALSALTGWRWAERFGGRFLVRIEDIDTGRARAHFIEQIFEDLAWLGISWEEPVLRQSDHFDDYQTAAYRLQAMGLLYPCFATRAEIAAAVGKVTSETGKQNVKHPTDPDGAPLYPGLCRGLSVEDVEQRKADGVPFALRLNMERALAAAHQMIDDDAITYSALDANGIARDVIAQPERWGDAVIVRKDVPASYHLAVVVDDARQCITHVTRGQDLEAATDLHRLLQVLLGLPAPLYHHHRLFVGSDGRKLSKSEGATSLRALREQGVSRDEVVAMCPIWTIE